MTDEKAVALFYDKTTAKYCSFLASTLALHPSFPEWNSLLSWTQSDPSSGYTIDGQLCFIGEGVGKRKIERTAIVDSMDSDTRAIFEEVRKSRLPLATWETKSASTCSPEVMSAVLLLGEFNWTFCAANDCNTNGKHKNPKEKANRAFAGPDAQTPPWKLPADEDPLQRPVTRSAVASGSSTLSEHGSPMKDKRKRDDEEDRHYTTGSGSSTRASPLSEHGSPGKKRKRDDETYDITAKSLVQRVTCSTMPVKIILMCQLYTGVGTSRTCRWDNHHRRSQTLYVSNIIYTPTCSDPGYGKLHVGIYVAAIQDMMDRRRQQLSKSKPSGDGGDLISDGKDQDDQDHNRGSGSDRRGGHSDRFQGRKGPTDDELVVIEVR